MFCSRSGAACLASKSVRDCECLAEVRPVFAVRDDPLIAVNEATCVDRQHSHRDPHWLGSMAVFFSHAARTPHKSARVARRAREMKARGDAEKEIGKSMSPVPITHQ